MSSSASWTNCSPPESARLAGGRVGAEQPRDGAGDLVGLAGAAERDLVSELGGPLRVGVDLGPDDPRRDAVHADVRGELLCEADRDRLDRGLGARVVDVLVGGAAGGGA